VATREWVSSKIGVRIALVERKGHLMSSRQIRHFVRASLLGGAALGALSVGAVAKDLPATPEGAQKLAAFFAKYLGAPAPGAPPAYVVAPEGSDYALSIDLPALTAPFKAAGLSYDSAKLNYKLFEQDDGAWRVEHSDLPTISAHGPRGASTVSLTGYKGQWVIDPAAAWWRSATASADKAELKAHAAPNIDETLTSGALQFTGSGKSSADGASSSLVQESAADVALTVVAAPKGDPGTPNDSKPVNVTAHVDKLAANIALDGVKSRAILDLWAFLVAHPSRPELAANEPALKTLLSGVLASPLKANETVALQKIGVQIPQGAIAMDSAEIGVGGATGLPAAFQEHVAVAGLALPPGMVPDMYRDLVPTSLDIGFKASGFDFAAAAAEAIADMHLAGDGPPLSEEDRAKVWAKLLGPGPLVIDVPPSHVVAPHLDIAIEGQVRYVAGKPTGSLTLHMRNFDNTFAALKGLGPEAERKLVPVLAMAKGLAKTEGDGALTWVGELGADGAMKVNGLPLGKAPM
jgi:hypothetical protein